MMSRGMASWIARITAAALVGVVSWVASAGGVGASSEIEVKPRPHTTAVQPDLLLTLNPLGQPRSRSVGPGGTVSVIAWALSKNDVAAGSTSMRVVFPMGFTNVTLIERGGLDCEQWGPKPELGGTVVRCEGYMQSDAIFTIRIDATAPLTAGGKYEVVGTADPGDEDVDENNNYDSVWFTIAYGGTETKPRPHTTKNNGIETRPNPITRQP